VEAIFNRRSIRKYTDEPVTDTELEALLRAALSAPSAGNCHPWELIVVRDRATLDAIADFHPYAAMLRQAPLALCVCGSLDRQRGDGYWVLDCSAATENILIEAQALNLGAVWLGIYPRPERVEKLTEILALPENVQPLSLVAIGHPAEVKDTPDRLDYRFIHHERW